MCALASISYFRSSNDQELLKVLELQRRNVKSVLSTDDVQSQGFVTVVHSLDTLRRMHQLCPHILAKMGQELVGYALAMDRKLRFEVPILASLFELTDTLLPERNYLVMGQVCVDKPFRGTGVFSGMYDFYKNQLHQDYDCLVTEVANENQRSLGAHLHVGFEIFHTRVEHDVEWNMLVWNWR